MYVCIAFEFEVDRLDTTTKNEIKYSTNTNAGMRNNTKSEIIKVNVLGNIHTFVCVRMDGRILNF